mgnify:CR=1 FL=1
MPSIKQSGDTLQLGSLITQSSKIPKETLIDSEGFLVAKLTLRENFNEFNEEVEEISPYDK